MTTVTSRLRLLVDTLKNAPGIINARLYCGKEGDGYCLFLTAWEDEEAGRRRRNATVPRTSCSNLQERSLPPRLSSG